MSPEFGIPLEDVGTSRSGRSVKPRVDAPCLAISQRGPAIGLSVAVFVTAMAIGLSAAAAHYNIMYPGRLNPSCSDGGPSYNQGDYYCRTDDASLSIWRQGDLSSADKQAIADTLTGSYGTTDLNVIFVGGPVYSGTAETDIIYQKTDLPSGVLGLAWCDDAVTNYRCDQHFVAFRNGGTVLKSTACHETGHGVGLLHGVDAEPSVPNSSESLRCMRTPATGDELLGSHNADRINATY